MLPPMLSGIHVTVQLVIAQVEILKVQCIGVHNEDGSEASKAKPSNSPVLPTIVLTEPDLLLTKAQTSTSYIVPGLSTGVVYCLCVAVLCTVLLQPPGDPLDGLSRYLS